MDESLDVSPLVADGIYTTCGLCFAIVAHQQGHDAWHLSRGEAVNDADPERA